MRKSTFVIAVVLVVALCVPAVAFAALMPSPQRAFSGVDCATAAQPIDDRSVRGGEGDVQRGYHHPEGRRGVCDAFVDADGDGVCDHCAAIAGNGAESRSCPGFADADGDGVCDNCAGADGQCSGYRDADGDGVCDNYGEGCPGGHGRGCQGGAASGGAHHGQGHGCWR